jgi:hypothetical protein
MTSPRRPILRPMLGLLLLVAALSILVARTTRGGAWQWDFGIYSAASRAWIAGENPYDEPALYERWRRESASDFGDTTGDISWLQSIVPPTTLMAIAPFALLPRPAAFASWYAFNLFALAAAGAAALAMTGLRLRQFRAWALLAAIVLLGPVQSGIHAGQPAIAAVACIVVAIWCASRGRSIAAGVLLGVAAALKLQLAAPFILLALYRRQWRTAAVASIVFAAIAVAAAGRLQVAGIEWWGDWIANIRRSATNGGPNDFTAANPTRDHLLNLQLPLYAITGSRQIATTLALLLCTAAAIVYAVRLRRGKAMTSAEELLLVAPAAVLTLLPVYHRYYDATLLIIPLAWAVAALAIPSSRRRAIIVLALIAPFALPVGWATNLIKRGYAPESFAGQSWWQIVVMPLQVWLLVALAIVLIAAIPPRRAGKN